MNDEKVYINKEQTLIVSKSTFDKEKLILRDQLTAAIYKGGYTYEKTR